MIKIEKTEGVCTFHEDYNFFKSRKIIRKTAVMKCCGNSTGREEKAGKAGEGPDYFLK